MKISGLQKLTLLDYPGKVACTVFLNGCNFRCPFCHNYELVESDTEPLMSIEEFLEFLASRRGVLDGVCITGGEPTIHPQLPAFLESIRKMGFHIKLDTNGYMPEMLKQVVEQGLVDYVAMDIKNGPGHYDCTAGIDHMDLRRIERSIRYLSEEPVDYEFRTTVADPFHDVSSITQMCEWVLSITEGKKVKRFYIQPFVDRDTVPAEGLEAPGDEETAAFVTLLQSCAQSAGLRGR